MPKTARQLDREIAEALGGPLQTTNPDGRFMVHGVGRRGVIKIEHAETPTEADRIARSMAAKDLLVTVFTKDPRTQEMRVVMLSNRRNGKMTIETPDPAFARAVGRPRAR